MDRRFEFTAPRDDNPENDGQQLLVTAHANGGVTIAVAEELDQPCSCKIVVPPVEAERLRAFLDAARTPAKES